MKPKLHLALLFVLAALPLAGIRMSAQATLSGVVRDSSGTPQIGAQVDLLLPDMTLVATALTDGAGRFRIKAVKPGRYAVKAMGVSFLPTLRDNLRIRSNTAVSLTLHTLYEVVQWLPAEPRSSHTQQDDWAWTLRSAANRPLLRWLEDGPLVVVTDGSSAHPKLKARITATAQEGSFGEHGERIGVALEQTPSMSRELLAQVDFAPGTDGAMEARLGFRQELGMVGSVQSIAAIALHPEVATADNAGLDEALVRSWETMNLGDLLEAEVGADQLVAHLGSSTLGATLPFATVGWRDGGSTIRYRMASLLPSAGTGWDSDRPEAVQSLSARHGRLTLTRGLHQEIGWEHEGPRTAIRLHLYNDQISNPVVEASASRQFHSDDALLDPASGLIHAAAPSLNSTGIEASVEGHLPGVHRIRLSYANGNALTVDTAATEQQGEPAELAAFLGSLKAHRTQMYSLALSGTIEGSGTHWKASYRWQPESTLTRVAPYAVDAVDPYLALHLRQRLHSRNEGAVGVDLLADVENLLAQGYRPYLFRDGSMLVFAQQQRRAGVGVAFTF